MAIKGAIIGDILGAQYEFGRPEDLDWENVPLIADSGAGFTDDTVMNDKLNIPQCIKNYGADSYPVEQGFVPEDVFLERLPEIAKNALGDACTGSNPRQPNQEEMEKILKCCYYDTEIDF